MISKSQQGKKNRLSGAAFERRVRADLEAKGWIVDKWTNNVDFNKDGCEITQEVWSTDNRNGICYEYKCKTHKYRWLTNSQGPFKKCSQSPLCEPKLHPAKSFRGITRSNGFPDFIAFNSAAQCDDGTYTYDVIAVESKMNGVLSKVEKEKCDWYLDNNKFSKILIASKGIDKDIVYKTFERGLKIK